MKILSVGIVCFDVINVCQNYPKEDEKIRALSSAFRRGGNAATFAAVIGILGGHEIEFLSTISTGRETEFVLEDLARYGVRHSNCVVHKDSTLPTSYCTIAMDNGSRSIVHFRDMPELTFHDFQQVSWKECGWIHFEGRNLGAVNDIIKSIIGHNENCSKEKKVLVSIELEKVFLGDAPHNIHCFADLVLVGKDFAKSVGCATSQEACVRMAQETKEGALVVCAWGSDGASGRDGSGEVFHVPAFPPPKLLNTVGAGDTFNAAVVSQLAKGKGLKEAVTFACRVAGTKCGLDRYEELRSALDFLNLL